MTKTKFLKGVSRLAKEILSVMLAAKNAWKENSYTSVGIVKAQELFAFLLMK